MAKRLKPMILVDDETVEVTADSMIVRARVRVWRAKDEPAVVLVEYIPGELSPNLAAAKFARRIWATLLHYTPFGMLYFETEEDMVWQVSFDVIGLATRAAFVRPSYEFFPLGRFDTMVGHPVFAGQGDLAA